MSTALQAAPRTSHRRTIRSSLAHMCRSLVALLAVCAACIAPDAHAQSSRDIVGGPITTQRLERFLNAYVAPTDAEAAAMDRLHESYLDRYRAEIEPEASALMGSMSGRQPSKDEYEKFLRSLDRMQDKISEADNQFFASATELLAESRRGGMQRVREARERQRLLSGIVQFAPMMLGGGAGFIDLPARAIREEYFSKVSAENREAFDAVLRSQEQRTLGQAREYNSEVRKALFGFFDVMMSMQEAAQEAARAVDPNNPDSFRAMEAQQRAMMEKIAALGTEVRNAVKSNFEANRAGAAALAALLPEESGVLLRLDVADAAVNSVGFGGGRGNVSRTRMRTLGGRIDRDPEITPEVKAEIANILKSWRRDQAQASEKLAEAMLDAPTSFGMFGASSESETVDAARRKYRDVGNAALKQIAAKLLDKSSRYVISSSGFEEDGTEVELYRVASVPKAEEDNSKDAEFNEARARSSFVDGSAGQSIDAMTADDVVRVAQTIGVDSSSQAVIEAVVDGWKSSQWDAQIAPLTTRMLEVARSRMTADDTGMLRYDDTLVREFESLRTRVAALAFELDEKLYADLASALGLAADDALLALLRLERTDVAVSRAIGPGGNVGIPLPLSRILARAKIDPAIARAVLQGGKEEFAALASSLPSRLRERLELAHRQAATERVFATRDQAAVERASREYGELMLKASQTDLAFGELLTKTFVDAFNSHAGDAMVADGFRRAVLASAYPEVYKRSDSAQIQLDAAQALSGLSDDQRARLAALAAEYTVVFEKLSEEMIMPPSFPVMDASDEATWSDYQKRAEAIEKARFSRNERTEKALAELRRILGADKASLVPGLLKDEEATAGEDEEMNMWMGGDVD
jgi:hypothetical protein